MFLTIKTWFWFLFPVRAGREEVSFWTAFLVDWLILASLTSKEISYQPRNPEPVNVQEPWLGSVSQPWVCPHGFINYSPCFLSWLCPTGHPHTALVKQCGDCWAWLSLSHRVVSHAEEESSEPKASWSLTHVSLMEGGIRGAAVTGIASWQQNWCTPEGQAGKLLETSF